MDYKTIIGVYIPNTFKNARDLQLILTKYGCVIKTRLGLHEVQESYAGSSGLLLLELDGEPNECKRLEEEISHVEGIEIQKMSFRVRKPE